MDILANKRARTSEATTITGETETILNINNSSVSYTYAEISDYKWFSLTSRGEQNSRIKIKLTFAGGSFIEQCIFAGDSYNIELDVTNNPIVGVEILEIASENANVIFNIISRRK